MNYEEIKQEAILAEAILANDVFIEVFNTLQSDYHSKWENSKDLETKERELYYNKLRVLKEVKREFHRKINSKLVIDKKD